MLVRLLKPAIIVLPLLFSPLLQAGEMFVEGTLSVSNPYVRLQPSSAPNTGAFMVIKNNGETAQRLVEAKSDVAKTVEIHNHINDNGMMKMRKVDGIDIPSNGQIELKPGSYHVMLIGLKEPLIEGQNVDMTLNFADGKTIAITAPVRRIEAAPPPH